MTDQTIAGLQAAFGPDVAVTPVIDETRMGRRIRGIDLSQPLHAEQSLALIAALDEWQIVSLPGQATMTVHHLERLANHFGAPIPHPSNIASYGSDAAQMKPVESRPSTKVNAAFPDQISVRPGGDSAGVYLVTNLIGSGPHAEPEIHGGQHWHTDIEFEPVPLSTSMFLVDHVPTSRGANGCWVTNPGNEAGFYHPESGALLSERRQALPLNGETAYADTAAAYLALDQEHRQRLDTVMVRRRLRDGDAGFLMPLVYANPRNGKKSLHSPVWASRGKRVAPAQIEGMTSTESRLFFDELEEHCLAPQFRYDHAHEPDDVTIWTNYATLHVAPPTMKFVNDPTDARLMYRVSCKGPVSAELPRSDSDDWIQTNITPAYRTPLR